MRKAIILLVVVLTSSGVMFSQWGPKIKLEFENDIEQTARLFIGVDTLATDGYDDGVVFHYQDSLLDTTFTLMEDLDLPPPPPYTMYCRLIRDTTNPAGSYSYVDFKGIPADEDKFFHQYIITIVWFVESFDSAWININWGELPDGIDSAKFRCYQWMDDDYYVNMRDTNGVVLDNSAYKNCFVYVWYNKKHTDISYENEEDIILYPNPSNDYISFYNENYTDYFIVNSAGEELMSGNLSPQSNNKINIRNIPAGAYTMLVNKRNGEKNSLPFVKRNF